MGDNDKVTTSTGRAIPRGQLRKRTQVGGQTQSSASGGSGNDNNSPSIARRAGGSTSTMMRMYTDDSPGLKVDPITVVVFSLMFMGSVFILHIWGKITRG